MGCRGEGRLRKDSQVCSMANWIVMTLTGMGKQHWESRMYLFVGNRLNSKGLHTWVRTGLIRAKKQAYLETEEHG